MFIPCLPDEDPNAHLGIFLEVYGMLKQNGVFNDAISFRVFPFSLESRGKEWLQTLPRVSVTTWNQLAKLFLTRYFPLGRTTKLGLDIASFTQQEGKTLYVAWEIYKDLLRHCPQHGLLVGWRLTPSVRQTIDVTRGRAVGNKTPEEARQLFVDIVMNSYQWNSRENK